MAASAALVSASTEKAKIAFFFNGTLRWREAANIPVLPRTIRGAGGFVYFMLATVIAGHPHARYWEDEAIPATLIYYPTGHNDLT